MHGTFMQYMEKLDRIAEAEHVEMERKVAEDLSDDEIEAAARAGAEAEELEQPHGEDGEINPKVSFSKILFFYCAYFVGYVVFMSGVLLST